MCYLAYACSPDVYQDSLYEYKLKNISKPKYSIHEDLTEEVDSSEEALELKQNKEEESQSTIIPVEESIHESRQSKRFSTILTETAENISSAITTTFITLTGGSTEEDIR